MARRAPAIGAACFATRLLTLPRHVSSRHSPNTRQHAVASSLFHFVVSRNKPKPFFPPPHFSSSHQNLMKIKRLLFAKSSSKSPLFSIVAMKTEGIDCMISSSRSRDLLLRFSGGLSRDEMAEANGSDSDEIELGLSLGGCFNSVSSHKNRILRTSSIPAILPPCEISPIFPLLRTCSLPDEDVKNKRMEAKRKREELEEEPDLKVRRFGVENGGPAGGVCSPVASRWIAGVGLRVVPDGSSSTGGSDLESRSGQGFELSGFSHASEIRSSSMFMTMSKHNIHKSPPLSPFSTTPISEPNNGTAVRGRFGNGSGELNKRMRKEMPLVSAKVDGPNGLMIQGFLYKYGIGEEVRIICVCHGCFHTPAEFVKHAGGGDVAHPLRHIVVSSNRASFV